jgi:hypothetical protein
MQDVKTPILNPLTGKPSFVLAIAAELADNRPFDGFSEEEWDWLRADLSVAQIEEGLTEAFEHNSNPSHSCVFQILDVARQRVEDGLPPFGKLWDEPSEEERRRYMEESRKRIASYND